MSDDKEEFNEESPFNEPGIWLAAWICLVVIFLLTPFCATARRRKICRTRLRERRWNVEVEEDDDRWFAGALQRYNEQMAARENQNGTDQNRTSALSKEEEEQIKLFIKEKMSGFSTVLKKDDFRSTSKERNGNIEKSSFIVEDGNTKCNSPSTSFTDDEEIKSSPCPLTDGNKNDSSPKAIFADESKRTEENIVCIDICDDLSIKSGAGSVNGQGQFTHVVVPLPGTCLPSQQSIDIDENEGDIGDGKDVESLTMTETERLVSKFCAVCLSEFEEGDPVCWSSNTRCPHAFHTDCMLSWYIALCKKTNRKRQREGAAEKDITDFPMLCPCCRQDFLPTSPRTGAEQESLQPAEESPRTVETA